jgi:hypothetical protein
MAPDRHTPNRDGATIQAAWARAGADGCAFDTWLQQSLADRHDGALTENLPCDWLDLIRRAC